MKNINLLWIALFIPVLTSCIDKKETTSKIETESSNWVLKYESEKLNNFNAEYYNKSIVYYWTKEKDTSDFRFRINEIKKQGRNKY